MTILDTINQLKSFGVVLSIQEGVIEASILEPRPAEVNTLLQELRAHKQEAIKILTYTDVFFDTYTYDPNMDLGELAANDSFFNELFKSWYERKGKNKIQ